MRALVFDSFGGPLTVRDVPSPDPAPDGVVVRVEASGLCRSDWHGWQGHDPDIVLPHVPGHELAGVVEAVGNEVRKWRIGDRVTVPFVNACGRCLRCAESDHQVCDDQRQPGFTHWGSFAELVALDAADVNLVAIPDDLSSIAAASLGCRYATSFRAITQVGRVQPGEWVAVHGCGGIGLAAVQIAAALGARVVAIDISTNALRLAKELGAEVTIEGRDVVKQIKDATGGAHMSIDALGSAQTCENSIACLRPRGRHVQVGLLPAHLTQPKVPMGRVLAQELELLGSHGMAAHAYPAMLELVSQGVLQPHRLVTREISLADAGVALATMGTDPGITVITSFSASTTG